MDEKCEQLESRFKKLNDQGKLYILAILQSLEFAQANQCAAQKDRGQVLTEEGERVENANAHEKTSAKAT
ncbi:hypothetical protein [Brevibacillus borstelensis]|uniref:hypothetical protein n=1 Tax=Brevibacillus borstelensis TaxID=45462 RepID=UPI00203D6ADD|nr:hypothetical protein [Brevibacillus borstelensis]MCM3470162.1 hypothetical protein [Brevibacillus borstelensis]MCM3591227.1 hypothetical protein [Brevibacillus borstelensis]